jgi:TRAP-type C4-dicarboxylate transport system permease small subunit
VSGEAESRSKVPLLTRLLELMGAALLVAIVFAVILQVFVRYVLEMSLIWTEELARYVMIWGAFVGAWLGVRKKAHFSIDTVAGQLGVSGRWMVVAASVLALLVVAYGGLTVVPRLMGTRSPALQWSMGLVYAPVSAIALFMAVDILVQAVRGKT